MSTPGPRSLTAPQRRSIYYHLRAGNLQQDEVGDIEAMSVGRASELIALARKRADAAPLGFTPPKEAT